MLDAVMPREEVLQRNNVSISDRLLGYSLYLKFLLEAILRHRNVYKNYLAVIMCIARRQYPIEAILMNGEHILLNEDTLLGTLRFFEAAKGMDYDIANDVIIFSIPPYMKSIKKKVEFRGGLTNGDISSIFLDGVYDFLPVYGKTVVDIGANIADSSIYFALRGAKKVIALEPLPKNYEIARKNIESNNLSHIITLLLAGCSGNLRYTSINKDHGGFKNTADVEHEPKDGIQVPLLSLDKILEGYHSAGEGLILKIDCEGCEYEAILSASKSTLQKFTHIQIEYHYGYENLRKKLENCGFQVSYERPIAGRKLPDDRKSIYSRQYRGFIFAKRAL